MMTKKARAQHDLEAFKVSVANAVFVKFAYDEKNKPLLDALAKH